MQHALTVQHENTHYWNITNYPFGFRTEIVYSPEVDFDAHKYHHICNEYMNLIWRAEPGEYVNNDTRERKS